MISPMILLDQWALMPIRAPTTSVLPLRGPTALLPTWLILLEDPREPLAEDGYPDDEKQDRHHGRVVLG